MFSVSLLMVSTLYHRIGLIDYSPLVEVNIVSCLKISLTNIDHVHHRHDGEKC